MSRDHHRTIIDVHVLPIRDGRILLGQRQGTGYAAIWTEVRRCDLYAATVRR
ncbi:MAG: hypothetical protein QOI74_2039 [Micromonosporaceae bacterium]|nr:hypothetical protein [Micromonosporaceae bacterium]